MDREEAVARLAWLAGVGRCVDSVTIGGDDWEPFNMALVALRDFGDCKQLQVANPLQCKGCGTDEVSLANKTNGWISVEERLPEVPHE